MKKIILAEKTRRKLEKAEAAARYDYIQGGRGHWAVYYSGPQSFSNSSLFVGFTTLVTFIEI